jgi:hypothetical protein
MYILQEFTAIHIYICGFPVIVSLISCQAKVSYFHHFFFANQNISRSKVTMDTL